LKGFNKGLEPLLFAQAVFVAGAITGAARLGAVAGVAVEGAGSTAAGFGAAGGVTGANCICTPAVGALAPGGITTRMLQKTIPPTDSSAETAAAKGFSNARREIVSVVSRLRSKVLGMGGSLGVLSVMVMMLVV
jgi:hypothetical protein